MALERYAAAVLADGPIGYWRLGEAPGAMTAVDASGHGNHGEYSAGGITLGLSGFKGGDTAALKEIGFRVQVAIGMPGLKPGPVSEFVSAGLGPDEALEIDCSDIFKISGVDARFLKGFVVIEAEGTELDVVAVYSAAGRDGPITTMHTERVPPRRREERVGKA
ncbi:hypothetical protein HJC10_37545 [Corallococcus exiguus]|uniref:hypothetical protein n=1 Tax=Corallococcus sp. AB030 TaxID=2316716 RepID=UPI0011E5DE3E|nr:hypothetical protein [Corallococcus sp. AB030]NNC08530.1 hypothetical protein [Corallococcus exiguus]